MGIRADRCFEYSLVPFKVNGSRGRGYFGKCFGGIGKHVHALFVKRSSGHFRDELGVAVETNRGSWSRRLVRCSDERTRRTDQEGCWVVKTWR